MENCKPIVGVRGMNRGGKVYQVILHSRGFTEKKKRKGKEKSTLFQCQSSWHENTNWNTIFTSPTEDRAAILRGYQSHAQVTPLTVQKEYPRTSLSTVNRFTDWADPTAVREVTVHVYLELTCKWSVAEWHLADDMSLDLSTVFSNFW